MNAPKYSSFRPGELWLDNNGVHINAHGGGVLFHDDVYYWFGEHKIAGEAGNAAHVGVHVYSSRDLYNWTDAGIALTVSDDPHSPISRGCILERPKVIYNPRTKQFVEILEQAGIPATVRKRKGADIDAACGQLRLKNETSRVTP